MVRCAGVEVTVTAAAKPVLDLLLSGGLVELQLLTEELVSEGVCAELTNQFGSRVRRVGYVRRSVNGLSAAVLAGANSGRRSPRGRR